MCAITNPLVNSYKRLVPGYEAPVNVAWSMRNRSPLIRVPDRRGLGTRVELRSPDPAANPYLALAVMLAAGLDGVETQADYREPVNENIWEMSFREKRRLRIDDLPHDLNEALDELEKDDVITERARQAHHVELRRSEAAGVARLHHAGERVGAGQLSGEVLRLTNHDHRIDPRSRD